MDKSKSHYEVYDSPGVVTIFIHRDTAIDYAVEIDAKSIGFFDEKTKLLTEISSDMARVWVDNFKAENNNEIPAIYPDFVAKHLSNPQPPAFCTSKLSDVPIQIDGLDLPPPMPDLPSVTIGIPRGILGAEKSRLEDELAAAKARVFELESADKIKELDVLCASLNEVMHGECSYQAEYSRPEDKFHIFIDGAINGSTYFVPHKQSLDGLIEAFNVMIEFEGALYRQGAVGNFTSYIN